MDIVKLSVRDDIHSRVKKYPPLLTLPCQTHANCYVTLDLASRHKELSETENGVGQLQ